MKDYNKQAENIKNAVEYYNSQDKIRHRMKYIFNRYPKSKRRNLLLKKLREIRLKEMQVKFEMVSEKFGITFEKLNQVINGRYSLKLVNDDENTN